MIKKETVGEKLNRELRRLQATVKLGSELKIVWNPNHMGCSPSSGSQLSGEVIGKTIHIYEHAETEAVKTLKHEFLDYILSHEIEAPYKDFINKLVALFQAETYKKKENVVERLSSVI